MKRSDFFIRLTTGVIFLAVAVYVGVSLYNAFVNTYVTATAMRYTIEETLPAQGFIIRTETVLTESGVAVLPMVGEGERVGVGQAIAVEYTNVTALETASEIRTLRLQIAQYESMRGRNDEASFGAVLELSAAVNSHDFRRLDEIALNVETTIFAVEADIAELQRRLAGLEGRSSGIRTIYSEMSGIFSHTVDGFEHITPNLAYNMSPTDLEAHFDAPYSLHGIGKLITEFKWYYAAVMAFEDASQLSTGQTKSVQFFGTYNAEVDMLIENISRREDGQAVVLFSSDRGIHEITSLRALNANIVYGVVSGIRVPRDAIRLDDSGDRPVTYVYLETSGFAERVDVEILRDTGDSYLVRNGAESDPPTPLRIDSIIIVRANNLYHGKVVA